MSRTLEPPSPRSDTSMLKKRVTDLERLLADAQAEAVPTTVVFFGTASETLS